ncbi:MAG: hypothetical protein ACPG7E_01190 [Marinirhabdus sp.]
MKTPILIVTALISIAVSAQTPYEKDMRKAFGLWETGQPWEAVTLFERIASEVPDNWLPPFYAAQVSVIASFGEKDKAKLTQQLNRAQGFLNAATALSKDNPELKVLEAQWFTAWIVFDGEEYGMKYAGKVSQLYTEAEKMAPDNPRVVMGKAEWDMGSARFFGQPTAPYCKDLERALKLFGEEGPQGEFYPQGGAERAKGVLATQCKS